jgi:hypothetical protein
VGEVGAGRDPNEKLYRLRLFVFGGFAVLLAVVVLLSVAWVSATAYNVDWVVREVDAATITCCPAVSESPTGELLMTYGTSAGLMLATEDDGAWSVSPVMESGTSEDAFSVRAAAIAVDDDGYAHIASVSYWPEIELLGLNRLIYSEMTSSGWENTVVDEDASTLEVSIAVDSNSNAHISYASDTDFPYAWNLTYATDSTGEWIIYDISSQIKGYGDYWDYSVGSSIAVDGLDRPHVACVMDLQAVYVTNLTGTPVYEVISCGNAGDPEIKPSRPAILVDAEDIVHVICLSESQEVFDGPVTTTVVHYSVDEDSGSYENTTMTTTDSEKSGAATQAVVDPDGRLRLFYVNGDGVMVVTLTDDQSVVEETAHALDRETQGRWFFGLSVVLCDDGEAVMSKPYGPVGYLTDSFTLVERLSTATEPMWPILMVAVLAAGVLSVAVVLARKEFVEEAKWHKALKE